MREYGRKMGSGGPERKRPYDFRPFVEDTQLLYYSLFPPKKLINLLKRIFHGKNSCLTKAPDGAIVSMYATILS